MTNQETKNQETSKTSKTSKTNAPRKSFNDNYDSDESHDRYGTDRLTYDKINNIYVYDILDSGDESEDESEEESEEETKNQETQETDEPRIIGAYVAA
jgi:hypothetical protein